MLLFMSTTDTERHLLITDISGARDGRFEELATWSATFPDPGLNDFLHSLSVSPDGSRAYLAYLTAGFLVIDISDVEGVENPKIQSVTLIEDRPQWPGWGAHSAIRVPGRDLVLTTDEVYGASEGGGCPWGWARLIDITDETAPRVVSEFRAHPYNESRTATPWISSGIRTRTSPRTTRPQPRTWRWSAGTQPGCRRCRSKIRNVLSPWQHSCRSRSGA